MQLIGHFNQFADGLSVLEQQLQYQFQNKALATQALTHRSYNCKNSYERLEFLGDALLGVMIGEYLYQNYVDLDEGKLTRMRATMVRQETLVMVAERLQLYRHVLLGAGERKGGGRQRASILADCVEALLAAVYLDSGSFDVARKCLLAWYGDLLDNAKEPILKDAKSRLQEWLQANKLPLPTYELLDIVGNSPNQTFTVRCVVNKAGIEPMIESGASRRIAEQKCAERMINQLNLRQ